MHHLAEALSVERLADVAAMSPRNLLEGSALALKSIAHRCGFGSAARMRLVFAQRFGVTPGQYRDNFRRTEP